MPPLPLSGLRILDLSRVLSGPFAAMQLGDLGADIWKVEPREGDPSRDLVPPTIDGEPAYYQSVNRNKKGLCVDFRHPSAPALLLRLMRQADVVIENFLPKVKHELGIDYDTVAAVNPGVIYCSISGFGQSGPYADRPGLDNIFQGMAGLMAVTGLDGQPVKCGERIADMVAGLNAALAILAALRARDQDPQGRGQYVELGLVDCLVALQAPQISAFLATGQQPPKSGNGSLFSAPTETFATADRPINLCIMTDKHWRVLCRALGQDGWIDDPRFATNADRLAHRDAVHGLVAAELKAHPARHWLDLLGRSGVPAGPILTYPEVFEDPQMVHNGMRREIADPAGRPVPTVGFPVRYSRTGPALRSPPPRLGQHSAAILDEAGFSAAEITAALDSGVVRTSAPAGAVCDTLSN